MKNDTKKTQKLITVIGGNYLELVVLDLLKKCFEIYQKRDHKKRIYQVSPAENSYATSAIILLVICIESYQNRIQYFLDKNKRAKESFFKTLPQIIKSSNSAFPAEDFEELLVELHVLRDVIVHNHIYEVNVFNDSNWQMVGHRQKLLSGYGDRKLTQYTNSRTKKTNKLKLNVQPSKIGFDDLFISLLAFDLFVAICQKELGYGCVPFNLNYEFNNEWKSNLSEVLSHYQISNVNKHYKERVNKLTKELKKTYDNFVGLHQTNILTNLCPNCGAFGIHTNSDKTKCYECSFEIVMELV